MPHGESITPNPPHDAEPVDPYEFHQRAVAAQWCAHPDDPCHRLCAKCKEQANREINAAFCADNPFDCQTAPGRPRRWGLGDVVVYSPEQRAEYEAEMARRRASREHEDAIALEAMAAD